MILPTILFLGGSYLGSYETEAPWPGGISISVSLGERGQYTFNRDGCFLREIGTGRFNRAGDTVLLRPPETYSGGDGAWKKPRRLQVVSLKGKNYLLENRQRNQFANLARTGKVEDGHFLVKH